jgi:hypothetical protein
MEAAAPEKQTGPRHSMQWRGRTLSFDAATDEMLLELSAGRPSAWLRRLICIEYGRMLERGEKEGWAPMPSVAGARSQEDAATEA